MHYPGLVMPKLAQASDLLSWYDRARRALPWRAAPGELADPYGVWLSEVMLQQTQVAAVIPYFNAFLARWPTITDLAGAKDEEVMAAWAGLGYYARARNLLECARTVARWRNGRFPDEEQALLALPGIGAYTAAAIAAIAFGKRAVVVDGNVERVMARLFSVTDPLPGAKARLRELAASLTPDQRCGDYAQAVMDLGATICTPKSPACGICPWMGPCQARAQGIEASLPAKAAKAERPVRRGVAFWVVAADGSVLLRRRPPQGLLGGMMEIPTTPWDETDWDLDAAGPHAPIQPPGGWRLVPGLVRHTFTHFHLDMAVAVGKVGRAPPVRGIWCPLDKLGDQGLPTLMRKLAHHALSKGY
jgi:A/G-specific adenine glycosylase